MISLGSFFLHSALNRAKLLIIYFIVFFFHFRAYSLVQITSNIRALKALLMLPESIRYLSIFLCKAESQQIEQDNGRPELLKALVYELTQTKQGQTSGKASREVKIVRMVSPLASCSSVGQIESLQIQSERMQNLYLTASSTSLPSSYLVQIRPQGFHGEQKINNLILLFLTNSSNFQKSIQNRPSLSSSPNQTIFLSLNAETNKKKQQTGQRISTQSLGWVRFSSTPWMAVIVLFQVSVVCQLMTDEGWQRVWIQFCRACQKEAVVFGQPRWRPQIFWRNFWQIAGENLNYMSAWETTIALFRSTSGWTNFIQAYFPDSSAVLLIISQSESVSIHRQPLIIIIQLTSKFLKYKNTKIQLQELTSQCHDSPVSERISGNKILFDSDYRENEYRNGYKIWVDNPVIFLLLKIMQNFCSQIWQKINPESPEPSYTLYLNPKLPEGCSNSKTSLSSLTTATGQGQTNYQLGRSQPSGYGNNYGAYKVYSPILKLNDLR